MATKAVATSTTLLVPPVSYPFSRKTKNFIRFNNRAYAATRASCTKSASPIVVDRNGSTHDVMVSDRLHHTATPWLRLPSEVDESSGERLECFYSLADGEIVGLNRRKSLEVPDTAKCVGSTIGSWLAYVDYMSKDGSIYLANPFLNEVVELPSLEHLPSVMGVERDPKSGSILKYKMFFPDYDWYEWDRFNRFPYDLVDPENMSKMVGHLALSESHPSMRDCVAMACQGEMRRVAYCRVGKNAARPFGGLTNDADTRCPYNDGPYWYGLQEDYSLGTSQIQVVYCKKRKLFYTLFGSRILAFDVESYRGRATKKVSEFRAEELESQLKSRFEDDEEATSYLKTVRTNYNKEKYLVTLDNGDLLLVQQYYSSPRKKTVNFDVFRVVYPGELEWVRSLEDKAIFIGNNQSFSIKASKFSGVRPNSIYFSVTARADDIGIFNLEDRVITPFNISRSKGEEESKYPTPFLWVAPIEDSYLHYLAFIRDDIDLSEVPLD